MSRSMRARAVVAMTFMTTAAAVVPSADTASVDPYADWGRILERFVDGRGLVDFEGLSADREALDRFVTLVGSTAPWRDPERFPTQEAELAFHVNAYNALAMVGILDAGIPEDLDGVFAKYRFFKADDYRIGDREMSLYEYEHEVIRADGEERVHFVLNCMSASCPRLRRDPLRPETLDEQLDAAAREFANDVRHVRLVEGGRRVMVSKILDWFEEDFVGDAGRSALIGYLNRYRDDPIPRDAEVDFMDYDWTVIRQR